MTGTRQIIEAAAAALEGDMQVLYTRSNEHHALLQKLVYENNQKNEVINRQGVTLAVLVEMVKGAYIIDDSEFDRRVALEMALLDQKRAENRDADNPA